MDPLDKETEIKELMGLCRRAKQTITVAESCTGGLLGSYLTLLAGSSEIFDRGVITYTNRSKHELLGVPKLFFDEFGAVSPEVAISMAEGALSNSEASLALSVTGIAGPDGGTALKPVGLVFMAVAQRISKSNVECNVERYLFDGDRTQIRESAVKAGIQMLKLTLIKKNTYK